MSVCERVSPLLVNLIYKLYILFVLVHFTEFSWYLSSTGIFHAVSVSFLSDVTGSYMGWTDSVSVCNGLGAPRVAGQAKYHARSDGEN